MNKPSGRTLIQGQQYHDDHQGQNTIRTKAHFLAKDDLYKTEKPYSLRFPPPAGFPRQSTKLEEHDIIVRDARSTGTLNFTVEGCTVLDIQTSMSYEDYNNEDRICKIYLNEVATRLRKFFDASKVQIFEHRVRKRHENFPTATGAPYQYDQPTSVVHVGMLFHVYLGPMFATS